jgi:hypothetical protein
MFYFKFFLVLLESSEVEKWVQNFKFVLKLKVDDNETMPNFAQTCSNLKYIVVSSEFLLKIIQRPRFGGGSAKSELGIYEGKKKLNVRETMT